MAKNDRIWSYQSNVPKLYLFRLGITRRFRKWYHFLPKISPYQSKTGQKWPNSVIRVKCTRVIPHSTGNNQKILTKVSYLICMYFILISMSVFGNIMVFEIFLSLLFGFTDFYVTIASVAFLAMDFFVVILKFFFCFEHFLAFRAKSFFMCFRMLLKITFQVDEILMTGSLIGSVTNNSNSPLKTTSMMNYRCHLWCNEFRSLWIDIDTSFSLQFVQMVLKFCYFLIV